MTGEIRAVLHGLAEDAKQAGAKIAGSIAKVAEEGAEKEEANLARTLSAEEENVRNINAIRNEDPNVQPPTPKTTPGATNALRDWRSRRFQFGNQQYLLDKGDFKHILERHHPEYWNSTPKAAQTYFDKSMSINDVEDAIDSVLRQNRDRVMSIGPNDIDQVRGWYHGKEYVLGLNHGHIGQFYPK
jgi:hypothetical protein